MEDGTGAVDGNVEWTNLGAGLMGDFSTARPRSGTRSIKLTTGDALTKHIFQPGGTGGWTTGRLFFRVYFNIQAWPTNSPWQLFGGSNNAGSSVALLVQIIDVSGSKRVRLRANLPGTNSDGSFNLSLDTWYRIECRWLIADSGGAIESRLYAGDSLNSLETLAISSIDSLPTSAERFFIGDTAADATVAVYVDDFAMNYNASSDVWCGPGHVAFVLPAGDVTTQWSIGGSSPAATNWQGVDDCAPGAVDDGVTYNVEGASSTDFDRLSLATLPAEIPADAVMQWLRVWARIGGNAGASRTMKMKLWDHNGTLTDGPECVCAVSGWRFSDHFEEIYYDLSNLSKAQVQQFNIGYMQGVSGSSSLERRVSAIAAHIEWMPSVTSRVFRRGSFGQDARLRR